MDSDNVPRYADKADRDKDLSLSKRPFIALVVLVFVLVRLRGVLFYHVSISQRHSHPQLDYTFEDIPPSPQLHWYPCFKQFKPTYQCARLTVPMESRQEPGLSPHQPKVHIALLMHPGKNHTRPSQFSPSPLLVNPGGPGISGVEFVLAAGDYLREVVGPDQDIIGFDPRGIGSTTPRADCWARPPTRDSRKGVWTGFLHRRTWEAGSSGADSIKSGNSGISLLDVQVRAISQLCKKMHEKLGAGSVFPYLGSTHTARDMLRVVDAWDHWRWSDTAMMDQGSEEALRGKLVYWGFSYGTFLGATFAAMFPGRVGRLILDGVVDADESVAPFWVSNLRDTDEVLHQFFRYCHQARERCDFYRPNDKVAHIEQRYDAILSSLEDSPIAFVEPEGMQPVLVTAASVKARIFSMLYVPVGNFPRLGRLLNIIYKEDWERLADYFKAMDLPGMCNAADRSTSFWDFPDDGGHALSCSDKLKLMNESHSDIRHAHKAMSQLSTFANVWLAVTFKCNGWSITPSEFPTWTLSRPPKLINTSFPLLFIGNTHDPSTPFKNALTMALRFRNAALIEQKSEGHCTYAATSRCTLRAIRAYLLEGDTPPPPVITDMDSLTGDWKVCEADERPWQQHLDSSLRAGDLSLEDMVMKKAWKGLREQVVAYLFGD